MINHDLTATKGNTIQVVNSYNSTTLILICNKCEPPGFPSLTVPCQPAVHNFTELTASNDDIPLVHPGVKTLKCYVSTIFVVLVPTRGHWSKSFKLRVCDSLYMLNFVH